MSKIKKYWLEIIFIILIAFVVIVSIRNSAKTVPLDYGKQLSNSDKELPTCNLADYIEAISNTENCIAIFAVKDIQGYYITDEDVEELKSLGFDQANTLLDEEYHSFIGIWANGKALYQAVGGDESISYGRYIGDHYLYVRSATYSAGNTGDIYIDNVQYSVNNRGINVVTIDNSDFSIIDSASFDVYVEDVPVYRIVDGQLTCIESTKGN